MRYKLKPRKNAGNMRERSGYLWLPKCARRQWRWLEYAKWHQYYNGWRWVNKGWL